MAMVVCLAMGVLMPGRRGATLADTAHVVVVPVLRLPYGGLETGQTHAILTQTAVHIRTAVDGLFGALRKHVHQERMHVEIVRAQKLCLWMPRRALGGQTANALLQYARKQKKWKHQHTPE